MTQVDKQQQIAILEEHVSDIKSLQFGDYARAEYLYQRTKLLTRRFFPGSTFYLVELAQPGFHQYEMPDIHERSRWNDTYNKLLAVAQSMLDDIQLAAPSTSRFTADPAKIVLAVLFAVVASIFLWSFNSWLKWSWLSAHPKRTAIYLSWQLVILFIVTLSFTKQKKAKIVEWSGIAFAIAFGLLSLLN